MDGWMNATGIAMAEFVPFAMGPSDNFCSKFGYVAPGCGPSSSSFVRRPYRATTNTESNLKNFIWEVENEYYERGDYHIKIFPSILSMILLVLDRWPLQLLRITTR